ncbi:MAG: hypothetical protein ACRESZ_14670 [Methylococcales bacterium]
MISALNYSLEDAGILPGMALKKFFDHTGFALAARIELSNSTNSRLRWTQIDEVWNHSA